MADLTNQEPTEAGTDPGTVGDRPRGPLTGPEAINAERRALEALRRSIDDRLEELTRQDATP